VEVISKGRTYFKNSSFFQFLPDTN